MPSPELLSGSGGAGETIEAWEGASVNGWASQFAQLVWQERAQERAETVALLTEIARVNPARREQIAEGLRNRGYSGAADSVAELPGSDQRSTSSGLASARFGEISFGCPSGGTECLVDGYTGPVGVGALHDFVHHGSAAQFSPSNLVGHMASRTLMGSMRAGARRSAVVHAVASDTAPDLGARLGFPDFASLSIPIGSSPVGVGLNITVDRYGSIYVGPGVGAGKPVVGLSIGWINESDGAPLTTKIPSPAETEAFLSGLGGNIGAGVGVAVNWATDSSAARQALILTSPGVGVSYMTKIFSGSSKQ